ncbi:MAG: hypothetical protein H6555_12915 [Lewinellaceae bacterium]|nr:hypothetical protein [Lewinellaceae bacterium]
MLRNFFQRSPPHSDFSSLGTDFHSHLLPGIDDGAKTLDDSLTLLEGLRQLGYRKVITTPHIHWEYYPNSRAIIQAKLAEVQAAVTQAGLDIELGAAAEYYLDEHFAELLERNELMPVFDNFVLVEMSFFGKPPQLEQYLFRLQTKGYRPILAHPERYGFLHQDFAEYRRLKTMGCKFQLNLLALTEHYEASVRKAADRLLREGLIDYLGTDLHHQRHLDALREGLAGKRMQRMLNGV